MKTHLLLGTHFPRMNENTRAMAKALITAVVAWFMLAFLGGIAGIFYQPGAPPFTVGLFLVVPLIAFTSAYAIGPRVRQVADSIPLWVITISHVWRFVGAGFVVGAIAGVLPAEFGYPEGLGDVIAAVFCLPLAFAMRRQDLSSRLRRAFIAWNIFGLLDLLSAITLGVLYSPSSFGVLRTAASTQIMVTFPVSLIPTFFVPLFILLHLLALKRSSETVGYYLEGLS